MSLLTDEELDAATGPWGTAREKQRYAADAASAKALRAVAEWLQPYIVERYNDWCRYVIPTQAVFAFREGKMPREEKDAVHTTGKTPRTISPD